MGRVKGSSKAPRAGINDLRLMNGDEADARVVYQMASPPLTYGTELLEPRNLWGGAQPPEDWPVIAS